MLAAYKFYIDGRLVSLGPGRGEADVLRGNSTFLQAPYTTTDVTAAGLRCVYSLPRLPRIARTCR